MNNNSRFKLAIEKFDQANLKDPNTEIIDGQSYAKEWLYAQRMSERLKLFAPDASEYLQLAARAQHIERWRSPRTDYPEGRSGYKKWRANLSFFHAQRAGELMAEAGYGSADIERVQYLIQKRQLKREPETQTLEDVICLVFIQYYLSDFCMKHSEDKLINIIQKTWKKMSKNAQNTALKFDMDANLLNLITKSLA